MDLKIALINDIIRGDDLIASGGRIPLNPTRGRGKLLDAMLKAASLGRGDVSIFNAFDIHPADDNIDNLLVPKKQGMPGWPSVKPGKYAPAALAPTLKALYADLRDFAPDLIIPLGSAALWSVTGATGLSNRHGFLHSWKGIPVIPTWHPDTILKKYNHFMPAANDIRRAVGFTRGQIPEDKFEFIEEAGLNDLKRFRDSIQPGEWITYDIETKPKYRSITCIGLGNSSFSLCLNFWNPEHPSQSWWPDVESEVEALGVLAEILATPNPKIGQNFLYDLTWTKTNWGIDVNGASIDTRLMHFALFPELPHSLAELGATWCMTTPWKANHSGFENDSKQPEGDE